MDNFVIELFLLSIGASFVQRTTGFGFGIFIMTMLPSIMPSYGEATTLSGILAMTTSLIIVIQKYKYITWRRLLPILFTFIIISIGAIFVLKRMEYHILNILLFEYRLPRRRSKLVFQSYDILHIREYVDRHSPDPGDNRSKCRHQLQ